MSGERPNGGTSTSGRSLWRHSDFMKLLIGQAISQLGTQVTLLALPFTAILLLDATSFEVGLLGALEFLPFIVIGLPAGVWVDRLKRKPILIMADVGRFLALASIPVGHLLGLLHISQLYGVAVVVGACTVLFDVAYQSYLPSLVAREQLVDANSKLQIASSGAQLAGPSMAGALISLVTAAGAIVVDAFSYLASVIALLIIRQNEPSAPDSTEVGRGRFTVRRQIGEGLSYVLRHRLLRPLATTTAMTNLCASLMQAVLLLYAVRELGLSTGLLGVVFTVTNIGFLAGASAAGRLANRLGVGPTIVGSVAVGGLGALLIPLAPRATPLPFLMVAQLLWGLAIAIYNINQVSLRQVITEDRMQGRTNATMRFVVWGTIPIGYSLGGLLGNSIGLARTLWVGAVGCLLALVPPLLSPVRTLRGFPSRESDPRPMEREVG
jgi:MFS family permease